VSSTHLRHRVRIRGFHSKSRLLLEFARERRSPRGRLKMRLVMLIALDYAKDIKHIGVYFEEVEFNWTVGINCGVCCVCYNGMFKALFEVIITVIL